MRSGSSLAIVMAVAWALMAVVTGCDKQDTATTPQTAPPQAAAPKPATQPLIPQVAMIDWCKEHGVPESVCTRCNDSLTAGFDERENRAMRRG